MEYEVYLWWSGEWGTGTPILTVLNQASNICKDFPALAADFHAMRKHLVALGFCSHNMGKHTNSIKSPVEKVNIIHGNQYCHWVSGFGETGAHIHGNTAEEMKQWTLEWTVLSGALIHSRVTGCGLWLLPQLVVTASVFLNSKIDKYVAYCFLEVWWGRHVGENEFSRLGRRFSNTKQVFEYHV